jgi:hypothetical protein
MDRRKPFSRRTRQEGGVSGVILIDGSGSMRRNVEGGKKRWQVANQLGRTFAEAIDRIDGKSTAIVFGETETTIKRAGDRVHQAEWDHWQNGEKTIVSRPITLGLKNLRDARDANLLVILTDGEPTTRGGGYLNPLDGDEYATEYISDMERAPDKIMAIKDEPAIRKMRMKYKELYEAEVKATTSTEKTKLRNERDMLKMEIDRTSKRYPLTVGEIRQLESLHRKNTQTFERELASYGALNQVYWASKIEGIDVLAINLGSSADTRWTKSLRELRNVGVDIKTVMLDDNNPRIERDLPRAITKWIKQTTKDRISRGKVRKQRRR